MLFSSGVGYFEHSGQVTGNAKVEMQFKVEGINDLLKSMVVEDLGGGQVSTVGYGSKDPVEKTLKSFAIDLTANPTLGKLLTQIRGEQVEIDAPNKITGIIVGVESRARIESPGTGPTIVEVEVLNLLTDEGLRAVVLESVSRIKLVNEKLNGELHKALAVLATAHAVDKKTVTLSFLGARDAQGPGRLHPGDADLEDQLPAGAGRREAAFPARLGDRREHDGGRLEGRGADAGQRPADLVRDGPLSAALHSAAAWSELELYASLRAADLRPGPGGQRAGVPKAG